MATQEQLQRFLVAFSQAWNASDKSKGAYGRAIVRAELVTNLRVRDRAGTNTIALNQIPSYSSLIAASQAEPPVVTKPEPPKQDPVVAQAEAAAPPVVNTNPTTDTPVT